MWCFARINGHEFEVETFEIYEKISDRFRGEAVLRGTPLITLGSRISLCLSDTIWNGIIDSILESIDSASENYYHVTFCSEFEYKSRSILCYIYQDIELLDLLSKLLDGINYEIDAVILRKYDYLFQCNESNTDLVRYLTSNNGLYYYCDHKENKLIITTNKTLERNNLYFIKVRPPEQIHEYIDAIRIKNVTGFHEYHRFAFSIARPEIPMEAYLSHEGVGIYEEYDTNIIQTEQLFNTNQQIVPQLEYLLETHNPGIRAASIVSITGSDKLDGEYFVSQIRHEFSKLKYINKIVLIKEKFLPHPIKLKPIANMIATVGDRPHLNASKVKVKFPWSKSEIFIPILLPTCGNGYGASIIPHPGQRVLVLFEGGRPFIGGAFYDGSHLSCYGDSPNIVALKTKANESRQYNELMLDETPGRELISIIAAKDMHETINNNKQIKLVDGNLILEMVNGSIKISLEGDGVFNEIAIKKGSSSLKIQQGDSIIEILDGKAKLMIENGSLEVTAPTIVLSSKSVILHTESIDILTTHGNVTADQFSISAKDTITIGAPLISFNTV